ncbi:MAG TPA: hypothetical protein VGL63_04590 [Streptosporangiaceae bacterium]|jgi:hypothetical protein
MSVGRLTPPVRQLGYIWIVGSATMGSVAALFLAYPPSVFPGQLSPVPPVAPLDGLPALAELGVLTLAAALVLVLVVLALRAPWTSWLPQDVRGRMLLVLLVAGVGSAAWLFAATVTLVARFGTPASLVLGYAGGGLPYALAAATLQRSWAVNLAAAGVSAVLVVAGFVLVAARSEYHPSLFSLYFQYVGYLLGGQVLGYSPGGPLALPVQ